jgi:hypothetical protein
LAEFETARRTLLTSRQLVSRLLREKLFIAGSGVFAMLLGLFFLIASQPTYTATMTVAPPSVSQTQTPGQMLGSLSDMLGGNGTPESFKLYLQMIVSQGTADRMEHDHHVMRQVFTGQWDAQNNRWRPRIGLRAMLSNALHALVGRPPVPDAPSVEDLGEFLQANLRVDTPVVGSSVRIVSFSNADPRMASQFLLWAHDAADHLVRESTRQRTIHMIGYLRDRLPAVANTDEHNALTNLLVDQERMLMLLSSGIDYSAMVVDPPLVPEKPFPAIGKTLALFLLAGLGAASLWVVSTPIPDGGRVRGLLARLTGWRRTATSLLQNRSSRPVASAEAGRHPQ